MQSLPLALDLKYDSCTKIRIYEKDLCDRCIADPYILWSFLVNILTGKESEPHITGFLKDQVSFLLFAALIAHAAILQ